MDTFQVLVQLQLAKAIYASDSRLHWVANKHWIEFFTALRPAFKLPTTKKISTELLEKVNFETITEMKEVVTRTSSVAILADGRTNIRSVVM